MLVKGVKKLFCIGIYFLTLHLFALDYTNSQLGFKAKLPDGLDDLSNFPNFKGKLICLGLVNEAGTGLTKAIMLDDLGAPIRRDDMTKHPVPGNASVEKTKWRSFQIDVFKVLEQVQGSPYITFNAQVPLKPHAIQVSVAGPASEEKSLRQDLQSILASIEGPSNWLTTDERVSRGAEGFGRLIILIAFAVVAGSLIIGRIFHRRDRPPPLER